MSSGDNPLYIARSGADPCGSAIWMTAPNSLSACCSEPSSGPFAERYRSSSGSFVAIVHWLGAGLALASFSAWAAISRPSFPPSSSRSSLPPPNPSRRKRKHGSAVRGDEGESVPTTSWTRTRKNADGEDAKEATTMIDHEDAGVTMKRTIERDRYLSPSPPPLGLLLRAGDGFAFQLENLVA